MIFAMGAVDMASTPDLSRGHRYYREARTALQQGLFEEGSLELVQGLAIMANYLQRTDKPNSGYVCLGLAIRAAITLGLHTKVAVSKMSPLAREMRSRVWWSLVTLEAGCSITFGRPRAIDASVLNSVPLPLNINDEDLTVCDTDTPVELSETTLYSALITQAKLAQKAFDIQDRISRSVPYPNVTQIKWCGDQLKRESLGRFTPSQSNAPAHLRLAQAVQRWRQTDLQCIMYRPVLLSAAVQERFPPTVQEIVK
jgi:transcriptional regulatory protein GAL4